MKFVIDASAMLAWCFDDERPRGADALLEKLVQGGMMAPAHWPLELANIIWNSEIKKRLSMADAQSFLQVVESLSIVIDSETPRRAWNDILRLARSEKLTVYDAAYLELALRKRATLVSKDRELLAAAKRCSVPTINVELKQ